MPDALPIYSYWTGPRPAWIGLCLDTLRRHNPDIQILDDQIWQQYDGPADVKTILLQAPNVRSDYLRAWLLSTRGGIWVDADCICWRSLAPLAELLGDADFLSYKKGRVMSALLACRPGSRIAAAYHAGMVDRLRHGGRLLSMALGPHVLRSAIAAAPDARLALIPTPLVHPLQGPRFGPCPNLWRDQPWDREPDAFSCMLTHRALGPAARLNRRALLQGSSLISRLFRNALGLPEPARPRAARVPTVIVGALSGDDYQDRRRRCLETWIPDLEFRGVRTVFLRGENCSGDQYNVRLPVFDHLETLSLKTRAFCRWALEQRDWDYLFKCDDDTLIHPARFAAFLPTLSADYLGGRCRRAESPYASGGAGYFLSRAAAQIVAAADLPAAYGEDRLVGAALAAAGIPLTADQRFCWSHRARDMRRRPRMISTHGIRRADLWFALYDWIRRTGGR